MPTFLAADRGQSSVVGYALVVGLVATAVVTTVALGGAALTDAQDESAVARAEQTMTLFDSQAAQVALGDSSVYTVGLGGTQGTYSVDPNAGSMSIVQLDCDDNGVDDDPENDDIDAVDGTSDDDDAYIMDPVDLGRVTYTSGSTTLAYEGGGVWRKDDAGQARMISPPEFHYRGATLTLPVILARGSGAGSGAGTRARVTDAGNPVKVFPLADENFPPRCGGEPLTNPVEDGSVFVQVDSEYYRAWGQYFESRTDGEVTYFPDEERVRVALISLTQVGAFEMPEEGGSVPVSGASGEHSTEEFSITLRPVEEDAANFNDLEWSMYAEEGEQRLEIHLVQGNGGGCPDTDLTVDMTVYYSEDGGDNYQGWVAENAFEAKCEDRDGDGVDDDIYLEATFVDEEGSDDNPENDPLSEEVELQYRSLTSSDLLYFNPNGDVVPTANIDSHEDDVTWEPESYDANTGNAEDSETIDRLVNHYFAEFPEEFDLTIEDKNGNGGSVNEGSSSGRLFTGASDRYVTFIHVTENEITVEID